MINRICLQCRKEFKIYASRLKRTGRGNYCTRLCSDNAKLGSSGFWKGKKRTGKVVEIMAKYAFKKGDEGYWKGKKRFFDPEWGKKMSEVRIALGTFKGENNPSWKGGVTPESKRIRMSTNYKLWRASVLKRDSYMCVECGSVENLQADHIKRFADYPELRFELSNGRTLCSSCHKKTDTYGNRKYVRKEDNANYLY